MNLSDMKKLLDVYIDDLSDMTTAVQMFNAAKDQMAVEVDAVFPDITAEGDNNAVEFIFDKKWHELPVLYAAAMYKSADSSIGEKNSYMTQFLAGLQNFKAKFEPTIDMMEGPTIAQFTATDNQTEFKVIKPGFARRFADVKMYINGEEYYDFSFSRTSKTTLTVPDDTIAAGDRVTITWEINDIFNEPPMFYPKGW